MVEVLGERGGKMEPRDDLMDSKSGKILKKCVKELITYYLEGIIH